MLFELDDSIFETSLATDLAKLFNVGAHPLHRVLLSNTVLGGVANRWIDRQSPEMAAEIREVLDESEKLELEPSAIKWLVAQNSGNRSRISLKSALELMQVPLEIHVENKSSDSGFLLAMMTSEQRAKVQRYLAEDIVHFIHGGGSTLKTNIEGLPADVVRNTKRMALFDSDSLLPGSTDGKALALQQTCQDRSISSHCLTRRAAENYLSKSQLYYWAKDGPGRGKKAKVDAFFASMNEPQRHHFRMREGWDKDQSNSNYKDNQAAIDAFYLDATLHPDWSRLSKGFGSSIRDIFASKAPTDKEVVTAGIAAEFSSFIAQIFARL